MLVMWCERATAVLQKCSTEDVSGPKGDSEIFCSNAILFSVQVVEMLLHELDLPVQVPTPVSARHGVCQQGTLPPTEYLKYFKVHQPKHTFFKHLDG